VQARATTRIGRIFADGRRIDAALRSAVREAIRTHQKRNVPVAVWREGRTVLVPPESLTGVIASPARKTAAKRGR
jgi:hypothetical protein